MLHPEATHRRGNWTDITRYLQDVWDGARERGEPLFWDQVAHDKPRWHSLLDLSLKAQQVEGSLWYPDLNTVDLRGRQLLVTDSVYQLFPVRHFPLEEAYEGSLCVADQVDAYHALEGWLFSTDGSCHHSEGGYAVVVRPPPEERSTLLIRREYIPAPCTDTKAEVRALTALIMIGDLLRQAPLAHTYTCNE